MPVPRARLDIGSLPGARREFAIHAREMVQRHLTLPTIGLVADVRLIGLLQDFAARQDEPFLCRCASVASNEKELEIGRERLGEARYAHA